MGKSNSEKAFYGAVVVSHHIDLPTMEKGHETRTMASDGVDITNNITRSESEVCITLS